MEAASRGWRATCVDLSAEAANVLRKNARSLKLEADIVQGDALRFAQGHARGYDIVFAAPPYPLDLEAIFKQIVASEVARELYIFQHPTNLTLPLVAGGETRSYGSNALSLLEVIDR